MNGHHRKAACRFVFAWIGGAALLICSACNTMGLGLRSSWLADYEKAERQFHESGKELLIWYKEARPGMPDPLRDTFRDAGIRRRLGNYITCSLLRSYEPDRRYLAQYGVERAPAVVVVHADGTYHARVGRQSPEQLHALLNHAIPPGSEPKLDPYIPRRPHYDWRDNFEAASAEADRTNRSMVVVFYRWLSRDRRRLEKLLERPEVFRRIANMVPCRLVMHRKANRAIADKFGIGEVPAVVVADHEGNHNVLELPTSYRAVVRFLDEWLSPTVSETTNATMLSGT